MSKSFSLTALIILFLSYIGSAIHLHRQEYQSLYNQPITFFDQTSQKQWRSTTCDDTYVYRVTRHRPYPCPIATRNNVKGKTVFLYEGNGLGEWELGGFGDTFMLLPIAKKLKEYGANKIIWEVPSASRIQIVQCCPYIDEIVIRGTKIPSFDLHSRTLSSLIFNNDWPSYEQYIHPPSKLVEKWQARLRQDKNFKIGICWQAGGTWDKKAFGASRSLEMDDLLALSAIKDVSLYSLQKLPDGSASPKKESLIVFEDLDTNSGAFMDTAALMENLDLIISVDTSIAHLAGALGKPTWILLTKNASWRWFDHGAKTTPWYPSAQLFWQKKLGNWDNVLDEVRRELERLINP